jgi:DMSO reductase anchor subunit
MAQLKNRIRNVLDESRMLVLASQLVLGLQFRSFFEAGFDKLPILTRLLKVGGLGLILIALGLLIAPAAYHRIVERGEDSEELHRYATRLLRWALLPFALGLGVDLFMATEKVVGRKWGVAAGFVGVVVALFFWYLLEFYMRRERAPEVLEARMESQKREAEEGGGGGATLSDKIKHVLTEARVVLPGAQALLGFQLIAVLTESFERLPNMSKYVHLASLAFIALTVVLLMTPAAYHRIVEQGEETEHFHRFASKMVVASLVPLALGIAGGVYVVVQKVTDSTLLSVVAALVTLALFWELWFGITLYRRTQRDYTR